MKPVSQVLRARALTAADQLETLNREWTPLIQAMRDLLNRLVDNLADVTVSESDFVLAGWGASPTLVISSGSTTRHGSMVITAGAGAAAGAQAILTYPTAFAAQPFAMAQRNDNNNPPELTSMNARVLACTTTSLVIYMGGASAPVAGTDYEIVYMVQVQP